MKTYNEYKGSGIEWLGQIPVHWEVKKLNYVCKYQIGGTPPTGNSDSFYGENKWLNISDIGDGKSVFDTEKRISDKAIKDNNILISPKGALLFSFKLSIGQVCFVGTELYTNEAVATFLPSSKINLDYAYYMFPIYVVKNAKHNIYGADLLNQELIASAKICYPSLPEQQQIAEYLDQQTAKIDELVQKQNKLIELLQEKKKSLINNVVTKGLNPDVQMKDSGIEWLGQIPEHWEVQKLKYIGSFKSGSGFPHNHQGNNSAEIYFLKVKDIEDNSDHDGYIVGSENTVSRELAHDLGAKVFNEHTIVFAKVGAALLLNRFRRIKYPSCIDNNLMGFTLNKSNHKFIVKSLSLINFAEIVNGGAIPSINESQISEYQIAYPPLQEQQQIAEYLDDQTAKIEELINKAKSMVELLKEHKQSLINSVVTGKIKVINGDAI